MNKPAPTEPKKLITRRVLSNIASQFIRETKGRFTAQDVYEHVKDTAVSANWLTLLDETVWSITRQTIDRLSTPKISDNDDWFGYGETVIKLPESACVKVCDATINDFNVRIENVETNRAKINMAADAEIERIAKIKDVMIRHNLQLAGEALDILSRS